ncbi:MAG: NAD(P)/FAD-dependent oxidoreductase [Carboxydocellales bacterium]
MGAGLSGLACAITLEKQGITPVIFEKRSQVGDRFVNGEILMTVLERPVQDNIAYLTEKHGIFLQPVSNIKTLILHSEHEQVRISGHLGFVNIRGREQDSFENQLARQVKSEIIFNSLATYEELLGDFTHVVLATGDAAYAAKLQDFHQDLTVTLKGVTVQGNFDRYTVISWLDNRLAPQGYGYLIPFSEKEATIVIGYPDYQQNIEQDINVLWDRYYHRVCQDLNQTLEVTDRFEVTRYIMGICKYPRIGNTFFVGNCFGTMMPFLGFGQFPSLLTGIYAAHDLCGLGNYEQLTKPLRKSYQNSLVFRRTFEGLDNHKLDIIVKKLNGYWGQLLFNTKLINPLKVASYLLRPWIYKSTSAKKQAKIGRI